jgi:hypothetical protein
MEKFRSRALLSMSAGIIRLTFFVLISNPAIAAESNAASDNPPQKETEDSSLPAVKAQPEKSSCANAPTQCGIGCNAAFDAENRAVELEQASKNARMNADKAANKAAFLRDIANIKSSSVTADNSGSSGPRTRLFWKAVGLVPRLFLSRENKARYNEIEKEAKKHKNDANPPSDSSSRSTPAELTALQAAFKEARESEKIASDMKKKSERARTDAERLRQSYSKCLSGMAAQ